MPWNPVFSQEDDSFEIESHCGVGETHPSLYRDFLSDISSGDGNLANGVVFQIPVNVVVFREKEDLIDYESVASVEIVLQAIEELNTRVSAGMQFYLCEYSLLDDTGIQDLWTETPVIPGQAPGMLETFLSDLQPLYENPNAVNVYVAASLMLPHWATQPWDDPTVLGNGLYLNSENASSLPFPKVFMHEMGHYFGLKHTFEGVGNSLNILPDNRWNPEARIENCACCDCVSWDQNRTTCEDEGCELPNNICDCNASNSGDFISDTDPHPNRGRGNCSSTVTVRALGQTTFHTYEPEYDNLMSYYWNCSFEFSPVQQARMFQTLLVHPNRQHLQNSNADCIYGQVLYPQYDNSASKYIFKPLPGVEVDITSAAGQMFCSETTNESGIYNLSACYSDVPYDIVATPKRGSDEYGYFGPKDEVSTRDLVEIIPHILGIDPLKAPYALIAADVNNSGTITTQDIIQMRKLILGISDELSGGNWYFVPTYALDLPEPNSFKAVFNNDPFAAVWDYRNEMRVYESDLTEEENDPEYFNKVDVVTYNNIRSGKPETWSFHAVKKGDVNFSVGQSLPDAQQLPPGEEYGFTTTSTDLVDNDLAGEGTSGSNTYVVKALLESTDILVGYQFELDWDPLDITFHTLGAGSIPFSVDYFNMNNISSGSLRTSWVAMGEGEYISPNQEEVLFEVELTTTESLNNLTQYLNIADTAGDLKPEFYKADGSLSSGVSLTWEVVPVSAPHQINTVYPNPVDGQLNLGITLDFPVDTKLIISDSHGNSIVQDFGFLFAGSQVLQVNNQLQNLANGTVYYQLILDDQVKAGTIIKL